MQVVQIKKETDSTTNSFAEQKENIKQKIFLNKLERIVSDKTVEFAKKYDLKINLDLLKTINVRNVNTVIYRMFGFGGKMLAAPFLTPFYRWYNKNYKEEKNFP